jgi:hypothetical protein
MDEVQKNGSIGQNCGLLLDVSQPGGSFCKRFVSYTRTSSYKEICEVMKHVCHDKD